MDYNSDGVLSKEDFSKITKEDLQLLAGRIEDRLADFEDIREDAKAEKRVSHCPKVIQFSSYFIRKYFCSFGNS
ncbi:hypothetical protein TNCV_1538381 [Trichonephila clavipes]|nr:hypothetical protein TNCV_1538381 [Trichonephila clavipes]